MEPLKHLKEVYLKAHGLLCPLCKSNDLKQSLDLTATAEQDGAIYKEVTCNTCGAVWQDEYTLTNLHLADLPYRDTTDNPITEQ